MRAIFYQKITTNLQKSLDRLSSGRRDYPTCGRCRWTRGLHEDAGGVRQFNGAANNVANALSFLQVQDGILDSVAQIVGRMAELTVT